MPGISLVLAAAQRCPCLHTEAYGTLALCLALLTISTSPLHLQRRVGALILGPAVWHGAV